MKEVAAKVGLCVLMLAALMLTIPRQISAQEEPLVIVNRTCAETTLNALTATTDDALAVELETLFLSSGDNCYTHRCQTHAECTEICGDVAKCCAGPGCEGSPGSGHFGYCVLM
ncbi:MAG TPA: hypothetical protein VF756_21965 [Thermoanaerobaculia bacterium]